MSSTTVQDIPPSAQLLHMMFDSFILSRAISVAAKLGIADLLQAGARTADELLRNVRQSMPKNGILLQVDMVVPEGNEPSTSKFGSLHMMVFTRNDERSEAEYRSLYERAGFKLTRVLSTASVSSILEGKPL